MEMTITAKVPTKAPDITPGYPSAGTRIGPAWQTLWKRLRKAGDTHLDGTALAETVAVDHELAVSTVRNLLTSAAKVNLLETQYRSVAREGTGPRLRTFYRINRRGPAQ